MHIYLRKRVLYFTIVCVLPQCSAKYNTVIFKCFLIGMIVKLLVEFAVIPISKDAGNKVQRGHFISSQSHMLSSVVKKKSFITVKSPCYGCSLQSTNKHSFPPLPPQWNQASGLWLPTALNFNMTLLLW